MKQKGAHAKHGGTMRLLEGWRVGEKEEHGEQQRARAPQALLWAGNTSALAATTGLPQAEAGAVCAHGALGGMGNVTNRFMK